MPQTGAVSHLAFRRLTHQGQVLAIHARYSGTDFGSSEAYVAETYGRTAAYLCVLQLHDFPSANAWRDGIHLRQPRLAAGKFHLLDLRDAWRTEVLAPFDNVHINVTQATLNEIADESDLAPISLAMEPLQPTDDEIVRNLARMLLPALRRPTEVSSLFAHHIQRATAIHLAERYGGIHAAHKRVKGGLAPWQERRARDLIVAHVQDDIDMGTLAQACGISTGHFARAFRETVGMPPHRWLLRQRVDQACEMLLQSDKPLGAIAASCGFADQSHMTRVFKRAIGVTPGAWRRIRRT